MHINSYQCQYEYYEGRGILQEASQLQRMCQPDVKDFSHMRKYTHSEIWADASIYFWKSTKALDKVKNKALHYAKRKKEIEQ